MAPKHPTPVVQMLIFELLKGLLLTQSSSSRLLVRIFRRQPLDVRLKLENWKELFEAVGLTAIVGSLVFVGIELRQSRAIAISEGNLANAQIQIESNNAINDYSNIWTRGNSGEPLAEHDAVIFQNLVKNVAIHAFMEYARLDQVDFDEAAEMATAQFSVFLFQNPGAREDWHRTEAFLAKNFATNATHTTWKDKVGANLAKLDRGAAQ